MPHRKMPKFFINAFYESKFRDNLFIVKASGKIIEDDSALATLMSDILQLTTHGIKALLVYGGGDLLDKEVEARGIGVKRENGLRVTDQATLDIMKQVIAGTLSTKVLEAMAAVDLDGFSLNCVPADWMEVSLRPKTKGVDVGFVGDMHSVNNRPINRLFKITNFVAVPCMAYAGKEKTLCNINADRIATKLAIGTKAHKLIFLSDVDGVHVGDETAFIITGEEIPGLIKDGTVTGGMQVKLENCQRALEAGVKRIHLINGLREHALKKEIFEPVGPGTMLIAEAERQHYMNEVEAQKIIEAQK